jgi:hypothetical protein
MMSVDKREHEVSDPSAAGSGFELRLGEVDRDGALADGLERCGFTRVDLLRSVAVGTGVLAGTLLTPPATAISADASSRSDAAILNFALALEYLQADFYSEAERLTALGKETARQARVVGAHERSHVEALRDVLGRQAIKKPSYNFRGATEDEEAFRRTAVAFEDLSVAAYAGQAPRIESQPYLVAALGILAVEARHASWIRGLAGQQRASTAFDEPKSEAEVRRLVRATRFVTTSRPRTTGRRNPRYTG